MLAADRSAVTHVARLMHDGRPRALVTGGMQHESRLTRINVWNASISNQKPGPAWHPCQHATTLSRVCLAAISESCFQWLAGYSDRTILSSSVLPVSHLTLPPIDG